MVDVNLELVERLRKAVDDLYGGLKDLSDQPRDDYDDHADKPKRRGDILDDST